MKVNPTGSMFCKNCCDTYPTTSSACPGCGRKSTITLVDTAVDEEPAQRAVHNAEANLPEDHDQEEDALEESLEYYYQDTIMDLEGRVSSLKSVICQLLGIINLFLSQD